jgi:hypothetical protein
MGYKMFIKSGGWMKEDERGKMEEGRLTKASARQPQDVTDVWYKWIQVVMVRVW